jgi:hypothetical protein
MTCCRHANATGSLVDFGDVLARSWRRFVSVG